MNGIETTEEEMSELIRLSARHGPVNFTFPGGRLRRTAANAWAIRALAEMRGVLCPDFLMCES